ncbi:MAG: aminodeoxychorismate/anthranilate synthase component II [Saprospiraceae bacterium]|nr:aminodeoxychorismate/anthranilate synthase component II [Saprospiraceae bacterium]
MNDQKKILVIDNYDSFTYNLVHIVEEILGYEVDVLRNDEIPDGKPEEYTHLILSPGPGIPDEAGDLKEIIRQYGDKKIILGVCLGLQAIGEVYGGKLKNLDRVFHGISTTMIQTDNPTPIFGNIDKEFEAGRYHSWVIVPESMPDCLEITAEDSTGEIMAIQHKDLQVYGVQFHPESIMTPDGKTMINNFLNIT